MKILLHILTFCVPSKKKETAAVRKLYMCQDFMTFKMSQECH